MLSIVIPCRDEADSIYRVVTEIQHVLQTHDVVHEIIVVNNNSVDTTAAEATRVEEVKVIDCTQIGYGAAVLKGIEHASYDLICTMDGDGSYDPIYIPELLTLYKKHTGVDMAMGNRFISTDKTNMNFIHRAIGVPALNTLIHILFPSPEKLDSHSGLRIFHKKLVQELHLHHPDFSFTTETICKTLKAKKNIQQIPMILRKDWRVHNMSKIKTIRDGFYALKTIISIRCKN